MIAQHTTHIAFAPPSHQGQYKFQVLNDGTVQMVDNHNVVTRFAILEKESTQKLIASIDSLGSVILTKPGTPPCMDAPSEVTVAQKSDGKQVVIARRGGCRDYITRNYDATRIAQVVVKLKDVFAIIKRL